MNNCPTSRRSAIVPRMSSESPRLSEALATPHGHREHWDHSRDPGTIDDAEAWAAVLRRDRAYDGRFVTGVLSTGIYCRPSCAARHPRRDNVRFFATGAEAAAAGLRACLRCRPDEVTREAAALDKAFRLLDRAESPP